MIAAFIFFGIIYILFGRLFGYNAYRDDLLNVYLMKRGYYDDSEEYEKNIRPKYFRNILRIISILLWPIILLIYTFCLTWMAIKYTIKSFIKFFVE